MNKIAVSARDARRIVRQKFSRESAYFQHVKKKYNQYKFIMNMTGTVIGAFGKIGKVAALAL